MIELQAYRIAIGRFHLRTKCKQTAHKVECDHDANAMGIALICTLLIIGGLELNPGPSAVEEYDQSGPSFTDATMMDVMHAICGLHAQLDQLSLQMHELKCQMNELTLGRRTEQHEHVPGEVSPNGTDQSTNHTHTLHPAAQDDDAAPPESPERCGRRTVIRKNGAILIGSENVHRIRAAAMEEFVLDSNVSFVTAKSSNITRSLSDAMVKSRAQKIDIVLNTGADQLITDSADSILENIACQITYARRKKKTKEVFVCSVEERQDLGVMAAETAKIVNQELKNLCSEYKAKYLDLRPRLALCQFSGINKTGRLLTFEAARNVAQEILSEVPGFLD